ncbi:MAG: class F sortase [bacterium]|nr:class F sortase [bacterium]
MFLSIISLVLVFNLPIQNSFAVEQINSGLPVRLEIPKIAVNTAIEHIGLSPDGKVGIPKDIFHVAWFNNSPRPGDRGNSIITGHSGWYNKAPTVFDNLYKLQKGDKIYVTNDMDVVIIFTVSKLETYTGNKNFTDIFVSNDEEEHLNLITCWGIWNEKQQNYSDRLVVFADREIE